MNTACSTDRTEKHPCKWSASCIAVIAVFLGTPTRQGRHKGYWVICLLMFFKKDFYRLFFFNLKLKILISFVWSKIMTSSSFRRSCSYPHCSCQLLLDKYPFPLLADFPLRERTLISYWMCKTDLFKWKCWGDYQSLNGVNPFVR